MNNLIPIILIRLQPSIAESYFGNLQQRSRPDVDSAVISLRGAIRGIQVNYNQIFFLKKIYIYFYIN